MKQTKKEKPIELYDDVLAQEPQIEMAEEMSTKEYNQWESRFSKKLNNSLGYIEPSKTARFFLDKKDKPSGSPTEEEIVWSVSLGNGCYMDFESQENAEIMSVVAQVNERLKRVQKEIKELRIELKEVKPSKGIDGEKNDRK